VDVDNMPMPGRWRCDSRTDRFQASYVIKKADIAFLSKLLAIMDLFSWTSWFRQHLESGRSAVAACGATRQQSPRTASKRLPLSLLQTI